MTVAAAVGLLLQATTKSRSHFASLPNNVLVSRLKDIVCSSWVSGSSSSKSNYRLPCWESRHLTTSARRSFCLNRIHNYNIVMAPKKRVCIIGSGNWLVFEIHLYLFHFYLDPEPFKTFNVPRTVAFTT